MLSMADLICHMRTRMHAPTNIVCTFLAQADKRTNVFLYVSEFWVRFTMSIHSLATGKFDVSPSPASTFVPYRDCGSDYGCEVFGKTSFGTKML